MSVNVGSLIATLSADHAPLRADLAKGQKMFEDYGARSEKAVSGVGASIKGLLPLIGGLVTAAGAMGLAKSFFDSAVQAERLATSLDTITKGHGKETFEILDKWAARLPVNTAKAIDTYRMLSAMGLKPTIKDMTTLVDTTMAMGGSPEIMERVARALGQMGAKGKISAEELMQLTEVGIPAYEILQEKLGITSKQMENLGKSGHTANEAITAIMEGLNERFGGASEKFQHTWGGVMERMSDQWDRFKRRVMTGDGSEGIFSGLTKQAENFISTIETLSDEGVINKWADQVGAAVKKVGSDVAMTWIGLQTMYWNVQRLTNVIPAVRREAEGRLRGLDLEAAKYQTISELQGRISEYKAQATPTGTRAYQEATGPDRARALDMAKRLEQTLAWRQGNEMAPDPWVRRQAGSGELPGSAKKPGAVALAELTKGELKELMGESPEYLDLLSASRNPTKLSQLMEKAAPSFEDAGFARFQERAQAGEEWWKTFVVDWVRDGELGAQSVQDSLEEPFRAFQDNVKSGEASVSDFLTKWKQLGNEGEAADFSLFPEERMRRDLDKATADLAETLDNWKKMGEANYDAMVPLWNFGPTQGELDLRELNMGKANVLWQGDRDASRVDVSKMGNIEQHRGISRDLMTDDWVKQQKTKIQEVVAGYQEGTQARVEAEEWAAERIKQIEDSVFKHKKEKWQEEHEVLLAGVSMIGTQAGQTASLMRQIYEDSGGQAKEFWEAYKAMAIAETVVATAEGVMNVWTSPLAKVWPAAMAMSAFVGALGATKVALIANQQPAKSFDQGGVFMRPFAGRITAAEPGVGPEVIAPLSKLPGLLRQAQEEGGGGGGVQVVNQFGGVSGVDPGTLIAVGRAATQGSMVGVATAMRKSAAMRELMRSVG